MQSKFGISSKKQIAKALNSFESNMTKSKNDLERLSILDDLDMILDSEINAWLLKLEDCQKDESTEAENIFNESTKHISDLQDSKLKLNEFRTEFLPGARKLHEVLVRQGNNPKTPKTLADEK